MIVVILLYGASLTRIINLADLKGSLYLLNSVRESAIVSILIEHMLLVLSLPEINIDLIWLKKSFMEHSEGYDKTIHTIIPEEKERWDQNEQPHSK